MDPQWLLLMTFHQRATAFIAARQSTSRYTDWLRTWRIQFSLMPAELRGQAGLFEHVIRLA